jgi:serine carboxypeptidase-like clade 1
VPRLQYHPYSWTKVASILFVDSPVGAGFSFSRNPNGYDVGDVSSSLQLKTFIIKVCKGKKSFSWKSIKLACGYCNLLKERSK